MTRLRNQRQQRVPRGVCLVAGVWAIAITLGAASSRAQGHWNPASVLSYGYPQLPPPFSPQVWRQFLVLYAAYQQFAEADKPPFGAWLAMNGVTDPEMVRAMLFLYTWMQQGHRGWAKAHQ